MRGPRPDSAGFDLLSFLPEERKAVSGSPVASYDGYHVNRQSLSLFLPVGDLMGILGWRGAKEDKRSARQLLGREPSDFPDGRVPLYVCPLCGDLGCGAISVKVSFQDGCVVWSEFGRQALGSELSLMEDPIRDLWFQREVYESTLSSYF
ncbi:MAG: hypothetical protein IPK50_13120 [Fibrobacterota bacterium]|nr:MAG: hypothetical protein IPK50_13120 [Fibrobacterota bacterium]